MNNKLSKLLPIFFIAIIIAVAGWYIGAQTFKISSNNNTNSDTTKFSSTTKDLAIIGSQEKGAIKLYKKTLDGLISKRFYTLATTQVDSSLPNYFSFLLLRENKIFHNLTPENKIITLDGEEISDPITEFENPFTEQGGWIRSKDKTLKAELKPILTQNSIEILTQENKIKSSININEVSNKISGIKPVGFSLDNNFIYISGEEYGENLSTVFQGFYGYNITTKAVTELYASDLKKNPDAGIFLFFDAENSLAYFVNKNFVMQFNVLTKNYENIPYPEGTPVSNLHLASNGNIYIDSKQPAQTPLSMINIQTKKIIELPIDGEFLQLSSDNKFLIYKKFSRSPYKQSNNNSDPANTNSQSEEFLDRNEYRSFNLKAQSDILLTADEQITNTFKSKEKENFLLGLIMQ